MKFRSIDRDQRPQSRHIGPFELSEVRRFDFAMRNGIGYCAQSTVFVTHNYRLIIKALRRIHGRDNWSYGKAYNDKYNEKKVICFDIETLIAFELRTIKIIFIAALVSYKIYIYVNG